MYTVFIILFYQLVYVCCATGGSLGFFISTKICVLNSLTTDLRRSLRNFCYKTPFCAYSGAGVQKE